jgi:hypothetical protein
MRVLKIKQSDIQTSGSTAPQPAAHIDQYHAPKQEVESFAKKTVLIESQVIDRQAVQSQESRAKELR